MLLFLSRSLFLKGLLYFVKVWHVAQTLGYPFVFNFPVFANNEHRALSDFLNPTKIWPNDSIRTYCLLIGIRKQFEVELLILGEPIQSPRRINTNSKDSCSTLLILLNIISNRANFLRANTGPSCWKKG